LLELDWNYPFFIFFINHLLCQIVWVSLLHLAFWLLLLILILRTLNRRLISWLLSCRTPWSVENINILSGLSSKSWGSPCIENRRHDIALLVWFYLLEYHALLNPPMAWIWICLALISQRSMRSWLIIWRPSDRICPPLPESDNLILGLPSQTIHHSWGDKHLWRLLIWIQILIIKEVINNLMTIVLFTWLLSWNSQRTDSGSLLLFVLNLLVVRAQHSLEIKGLLLSTWWDNLRVLSVLIWGERIILDVLLRNLGEVYLLLININARINLIRPYNIFRFGMPSVICKVNWPIQILLLNHFGWILVLRL
jgi:hypothetical protein